MSTIFELKTQLAENNLNQTEYPQEEFLLDLINALTSDYPITQAQADFIVKTAISENDVDNQSALIDKVRSTTENFCVIRDFDKDYYNIGNGYQGGALTRDVIITEKKNDIVQNVLVIKFQMDSKTRNIKKAMQDAMRDYAATIGGKNRIALSGPLTWFDIAHTIPNEILRDNGLKRISVSTIGHDTDITFQYFDWDTPIFP